MMIFEEPICSFAAGGLLAAALFGVQLLLCVKARSNAVKLIPASLLLICGLLCAVLAFGGFGTSSGGFLGNVERIAAAIIGIVLGIAAVGVAAGWIVYAVRRRSGRGRT